MTTNEPLNQPSDPSDEVAKGAARKPKNRASWFEVDAEGLRAQLVDQPKGRPLWELWQNAIDEAAKAIRIALQPEGRGLAVLTVTDDSPDGFADLADSWTFFKASKKSGDPTKRGRFNTGEKHVLALCRDATITSTRGRVTFHADGTRSSGRTRREAGTEFQGRIRFTRADVAEALDQMRQVLVPEGVKVTLAGPDGEEILMPRTPHKVIPATLDTVVDHRRTRRATTVELHEPADGETPTIYEMGIPVVEHDGRWHLSVGQKVPLNQARDNVTPAYLRTLHTAVLDHTADELTDDDARASWVQDALPYATDTAVRTAITKRFGEKRVIFDPSNPESNKEALNRGYTVVSGSSLPKDAWEAVRRSEAMRPAGKVVPTGVPTSPDGVAPIPEADWTEAMRNVARYTREVGAHLLDFEPDVDYHKVAHNHGACWGAGGVTFNLRTLGLKWPTTVTTEALDELLIHEFAHHVATDHLTRGFYDACCRFGARLRTCGAVLR